MAHDVWQNPPAMESLLLLLGTTLGFVLSQAALTLQSTRNRRDRDQGDRRQVYSRLLATSAHCYDLADLVATWPTRGTGRETAKSTSVLAQTSSDLDGQLRASRVLFAEARLLGNQEVMPAAVALQHVVEEAVLAIKLTATANAFNKRWAEINPRWRDAQERFEMAARADLG
jgi:hypothetical protein